MDIKVVGIGNRIMKDDSIGIKVLEELQEDLNNLKTQVIIGETDIEYTLNCINPGDYVIIVDSSFLGINPGEVCTFDLGKLKEFNHKGYSMHQMSLVKILSCFPTDNIKGSLITVEAGEIDFGLELSEELSKDFQQIKMKVLDEIKLKVEEVS
ncbi:hydrogenase maturation protease [Clostridium punense]|uniref:Hydrogenase maturation protease n=1 Tax=Clostridium punense TaxID=1054297 RepID=A0ABS4K3G9_9CLOT|nr:MULTISPECIES: hydrogenase maturation protease [Clostridium]EQB87840.1 hypothetical protein M918_07280 [Clostridium sp. BL8]MBP2022333.1 hydrogenase maturation protease [Clostridium punense]